MLDSNELIGACDAGYSCAYANTLSWRKPTTPLPMENNPRAVFERLFGDSDSTTRAARLARIREDRSILDSLLGEVSRLKHDLGSDHRGKLTQYLDRLACRRRFLCRWPHVLGILVGFAYWAWLRPSWIGLLIAAVSLALALIQLARPTLSPRSQHRPPIHALPD